MKISPPDKGSYYRGLLVLTRRDRVIDPRERELMLEIGQVLDFDRRFCESAIDDLLNNTHIKDEPVVFSNQEIAECFLRDALLLAMVDREIHVRELTWLRAVAQANGFAAGWIGAELQKTKTKGTVSDFCSALAIRQYL